jgi:hypothetical protein
MRGQFTKEMLLQFCGTIKATVRDCGPPTHTVLALEADTALEADRATRIGRLEILKNNLNLDNILGLELNCDPDFFLETLLICVKNDVVSHQSFVRKRKKEKIEWLRKQVEIKKKERDTAEKFETLTRLETNLNNIMDADMRADLEWYRYFEVINNEKMTPRFLSLAKVDKKRTP